MAQYACEKIPLTIILIHQSIFINLEHALDEE